MGVSNGPTNGKLGRRGARLEAAVLSAAFDIVNETGVSAVTMAAVAKRAGVHETSVYRRWGVKRTLLVDALHAQTQRTVPAALTGSLRGDLLAYLTALASFLASPAGRATTRIAVELSGAADALNDSFWSMRARSISEILERHRSTPTGGDVAFVHQMLVAPIHMRILLTGEQVDSDFLAAIVDAVIRGALK
jgi:AcrR family transcriptional regulator